MITTIFSSSSLVSGILFGMLFAWFLASAAMTYTTGVMRPRVMIGAPEKGPNAPSNDAPQRFAETPPEQGTFPATASTPVAHEAPESPTEAPASLPLTRGRRHEYADPETASIAASTDSR